MPNQKTQKAARRRAQADVYANPPGGVGGGVPGGIPGGPIDNTVGTQKITWGTVDTYSVDANRLKINLDAGAISKPQVKVATDAPHFDAVLSMAATAYQTAGMELTVRYLEPDRRLPINEPVVYTALEVAVSNDPSEALSVEN